MAKKSTTDTALELLVKNAKLDIFEARDALAAEKPSLLQAVVAPSIDSLDNHVGDTFRSKPVLALEGANSVRSHIDSGEALALGGKTVITFTFNSLDHLVGVYNNKNFGFGAPNGYSPFNAAQKAEARQSIALWDDLVAPSFKETNGLGADIQFANSFDPAQAYAYYPGKPNYLFRSDVFVADPTVNTTNAWLGLNGYGATTLIHELGHSLGLSHPGAYNFGPGFSVNYLTGAEYAQDSNQYSIMSYWRPEETGASVRDWSTLQFGNAQTPLIHDILTIQAKYGADPTTRAGDTVYGFNSTANNEVYDFTKNAFPLLSIYDAGGNDTIDLSGFRASVFLDLHAGEFSSAGQAIPTLGEITQARIELGNLLGFTLLTRTQAFIDNLSGVAIAKAEAGIEAHTGVDGVNATEFMNLSIAYGTTIENGIGGSQRDVIWGNEVANRLEGRGGNDVLRGFEGDDTLLGGEGNDRLIGDSGRDTLTGGMGSDTFAFNLIEKGDRITDFNHAQGDKIDLLGIKNAGGTDSFDFTWVGSNAFSGAAGELRFANGVLEADTNGDKIADLSIFVVGDALVQSDVLFG